MRHTEINYRGFKIRKRIDVKTHTCMIYEGGMGVKCIAGDIDAQGRENTIEKAKKWIDKNIFESTHGRIE